MKLLVRNSDGRVLLRLEDGAQITTGIDFVEAGGRRFAYLGSGDVTVYADTDTPTADDYRYAYDGSAFTDLWPHAALTPLAFITFIQTTASLSDTDLMTARANVTLAALWYKLEIATEILRDSAITTSGLDALVAAGVLTAQNRTDILTNWPRERG